jgi:5-methylcytosine-specific restriction endonuclease McrA
VKKSTINTTKYLKSRLDAIRKFDHIRKIVLELDHYQCSMCGKENCEEKFHHGKALSVHHIDGNYGNNGLYNLVTLCHKCHMREG